MCERAEPYTFIHSEMSNPSSTVDGGPINFLVLCVSEIFREEVRIHFMQFDLEFTELWTLKGRYSC